MFHYSFPPVLVTILVTITAAQLQVACDMDLPLCLSSLNTEGTIEWITSFSEAIFPIGMFSYAPGPLNDFNGQRT